MNLASQAVAEARQLSEQIGPLMAQLETTKLELEQATANGADMQWKTAYEQLKTDTDGRIAELEAQLKDTVSNEALSQALARVAELETLLQDGTNNAEVLDELRATIERLEKQLAERDTAIEEAWKAGAQRVRPALDAALARIHELEELLATLEVPPERYHYIIPDPRPLIVPPRVPSPFIRPIDDPLVFANAPGSPIIRSRSTSPLIRSRSTSHSALGSVLSSRSTDPRHPDDVAAAKHSPPPVPFLPLRAPM